MGNTIRDFIKYNKRTFIKDDISEMLKVLKDIEKIKNISNIDLKKMELLLKIFKEKKKLYYTIEEREIIDKIIDGHIILDNIIK